MVHGSTHPSCKNPGLIDVYVQTGICKQGVLDRDVHTGKPDVPLE